LRTIQVDESISLGGGAPEGVVIDYIDIVVEYQPSEVGRSGSEREIVA
jgi:hypothetical protein